MSSAISLSTLDWLIIAAYFVLVVVVGLLLSRIASKGIHDYFLGGRKIPWWVLGASGSASNFDMTGTMVITSFFFALGFQGFWVASRGGLVLTLPFLLAFMGKWLRRSKVITTAEWMELRFGCGRGGQLARVFSAVANLVVVVAMICYFATGTGKFAHTFLGINPTLCAVGMVLIGLLYTMLSGLYGVVYTDLFQELMLLVTAGYIVFRAVLLPEHAAVMDAAGAHWTSLRPAWTAEPMHWLENPDIYRLFGVCVIFWVVKQIGDGLGGGGGGYMAQRYYAAADERSAGLMTAEWAARLSVRWAMVAGMALLGIWLATKDAGIAATLHKDPEQTLPLVLGSVLPAGLKGVALVGLIAAAMSTFDSTVNAGAAYWVRDVYQRFMRPNASERELVRQSYGATLTIALSGLGLTLVFGEDINNVWDFITGPLGAGTVVPLILRWYWWRFNGYGFAWGTGAGLAFAIVLQWVDPGMAFYIKTPLAGVVSLLAGITASLVTPPVHEDTLRKFYLQIRPFGCWGRFAGSLDSDARKPIKRENALGIANTAFAFAWQVGLFTTAITFVWHQWTAMYLAFSLTAVLTLVLYFSWYLTLPDRNDGSDASTSERPTR